MDMPLKAMEVSGTHAMGGSPVFRTQLTFAFDRMNRGLW